MMMMAIYCHQIYWKPSGKQLTLTALFSSSNNVKSKNNWKIIWFGCFFYLPNTSNPAYPCSTHYAYKYVEIFLLTLKIWQAWTKYFYSLVNESFLIVGTQSRLRVISRILRYQIAHLGSLVECQIRPKNPKIG